MAQANRLQQMLFSVCLLAQLHLFSVPGRMAYTHGITQIQRNTYKHDSFHLLKVSVCIKEQWEDAVIKRKKASFKLGNDSFFP